MQSSPKFLGTVTLPLSQGHDFEVRIRHDLMALPELEFASLVVRRIPDGICLEGVVTATPNADVCQLAREVAGVNAVLNHLVMYPQPTPQPKKG